MKILVTGINGFVGKILHPLLLERGHEVFGIDLKGNEDNVFSVDITDFKKVEDAVLQISPQAIVHLAGIAIVNFDDPKSLYDINVIGTLNILGAANKLKEKPNFLFISSSQVYGNVPIQNLPITEKHLIAPINHYGSSKAAAERIALAFHQEAGLPLVIARPFNHIGQGQTTNFIIPKLVKAFKAKQPTLNLGNTKVERDFLDVRDIAMTYSKLIEIFPDGKIYNIASGVGISISKVLESLEDLTGNKVEIIADKTLFRKNEIISVLGDASFLRKDLGWEPQFRVADTLAWMLEDG